MAADITVREYDLGREVEIIVTARYKTQNSVLYSGAEWSTVDEIIAESVHDKSNSRSCIGSDEEVKGFARGEKETIRQCKGINGIGEVVGLG